MARGTKQAPPKTKAATKRAAASQEAVTHDREPVGDAVRGWYARHRGELRWLALVWLACSAVVFLLASGHDSPRRFQDEFFFFGIAESLASGDGLSWRGIDIDLRAPLYPVLIAPLFWIDGSPGGAYLLVQLFNALAICGVVFPAYFMARLFVGARPAALAAALALAMPALNYAGVIGTESLAYPVATAAFGAIVLSFARPASRAWILAIALIGLAVLTRMQFVVFVPAYLLAAGLFAWMRPRDERREFVEAQKLPLTIVGTLFAIGALWALIRGSGAAGIYGGALEGDLPSLRAIGYWLVAFVGDLFLLTAVVPTVATLALALGVRRDAGRDVHALLAVAGAATVAFVAEVVWFEAVNHEVWHELHLFYERYVFYLAPLFFTGMLVAWRERVAARPVAVAAAFGVVAAVAFPPGAVLRPLTYDSFNLTLFTWLTDGDGVRNLIGPLMAIVALAFGVLAWWAASRNDGSVGRPVLVVAAATFAFLLVGQAKTWQLALDASATSWGSYPKPADFVDRSIDEPVGMVIASTNEEIDYFTAEFWNKRIERFYTIDAEPFNSAALSLNCKLAWADDGTLFTEDECGGPVPRALYLRSDRISMRLHGERRRVTPTQTNQEMTLMVAGDAPRLRSLVGGRLVNGILPQEKIKVWTFFDREGEIRLVIPKRDFPVTVSANGDSTTLPPGEAIGVDLPVGTGEAVNEITVDFPDGQLSKVAAVDAREGDGKWEPIT